MRNATRILLSAALLAASTAEAQVIKAPAGSSYTLKTATEATGSGSIAYQWFRNGEAIPNATQANYTIPAVNATGYNVEFKRKATVNSSCLGEKEGFSNTIVITFCGLIVMEICWAATNVGEAGTFASSPDDPGMFYQWNRTTAWAITGSVSDWNSARDTSPTWTNNPCPTGWQLPTTNYLHTRLLYPGAGAPAISAWAEAGTRGNLVAGRFFGPNAYTCTLPSNMVGCVFLPAVGYRNSSGAISSSGVNGSYWCSDQYDTNNGHRSNFGVGNDGEGIDMFNRMSKANGGTLRCIQYMD